MDEMEDIFATDDFQDDSFSVMFGIWSDLESISDWMKAQHKADSHPFMIEDASCPDESVKAAIHRLNQYTFNTLFPMAPSLNNKLDGEESKQATFGLSIENAINELGQQDYSIFVQRFLTETPASLRKVGEKLKVTGERVRQCEKEIRKRIQPVFDDFSIEQKLSKLFTPSRPYIPVNQAYQLFPELGGSLPGLQVPNLWLIHNFSKYQFEVKDGWIASPSIKDAQRLFKVTIEREANDYGAVPVEALDNSEIFDETGNRTGALAAWVKYCGLVSYKNHILLSRNTREQVAAILSIEQHPMAAEELLAIIHPGGDIKVFRGKLYADPVITRVDVRKWALRIWGLEEYSSTSQAIKDCLTQNKGSMPYRQLVKEITDKFTVSESNIFKYTSTRQFKIEKGIISFNENYFDELSTEDPFGLANLYRIKRGWAWRVLLTERNSFNMYLPKAIASVLQIKHGEQRFLPSPLAEQGIFWTSDRLSIGTVRRFVNDEIVHVNQEVFYMFYDDGSFNLLPMRELNGAPLHDALALTCGPDTSDVDEACRHFGHAIHLDGIVQPVVLAGRYKQRGDEDVADLLAMIYSA